MVLILGAMNLVTLLFNSSDKFIYISVDNQNNQMYLCTDQIDKTPKLHQYFKKATGRQDVRDIIGAEGCHFIDESF